MAYLHRMRNCANPPQPSDENLAQDPPATPLTSATVNARGTGMPLVAFGQLVKHRANLKDQSAIVLDQFCENSSADERQVMLYACLLEVHDTLKRNEKADEWKITSALKANISVYSQAFLLTSTTAAYWGLHQERPPLGIRPDCPQKWSNLAK
ncbi:hypothetical protein B0H10DRAFT_1970490 [Mycena sp. CBHHK59/15]|nr:hypothetical protein B0H10DRAFT_1970490 [Mycena sp. CBHHK59/15]